MPFIGIGFQGSIAPDLGLDVVIVDFEHAIGPDDQREFFYRIDGRSSVPRQREPAEIIERNFVETVGVGEADVVRGKIREGNPDLPRVLVFEVVGAGGLPLATVLIDWAMTDGAVPKRIPDEFRQVPLEGPGPFTPIKLDLPPTPAGAATVRLVPRLRELDPMGHANNGVYLDWLDEAVVAGGGTDAVVSYPRRYRLEYLRPAGPGAALVSAAWRDEAGWAYRLAAEDGAELLRGRLDPVGPEPT